MSIATERLTQAYLQAVDAGTIGGADIWRDLARLSHGCIEGHTPQQRALAFCLHHAFAALWRDFDERPVTAEEVRRLMGRAHEPFLRAMQLLDKPREDADALSVLAAIADLEVGSTGP